MFKVQILFHKRNSYKSRRSRRCQKGRKNRASYLTPTFVTQSPTSCKEGRPDLIPLLPPELGSYTPLILLMRVTAPIHILWDLLIEWILLCLPYEAPPTRLGAGTQFGWGRSWNNSSMLFIYYAKPMVEEEGSYIVIGLGLWPL